jgi:hypothetical protein
LRGRPFGHPPSAPQSLSCFLEYRAARAFPPCRPASATVIDFFMVADFNTWRYVLSSTIFHYHVLRFLQASGVSPNVT